MKKSLKASAKKVKPVKGWAIVSPEGKIMASALSPFGAWCGMPTYLTSRDDITEHYKSQGYRCIRVLITPAV